MRVQYSIISENTKLGKNVKIEDFCMIGRGKKKGKLIIGDNAVIRSHTVIYLGNKIGKNFMTGHGVLIREDNKIGDNVSIGTNTDIEHHIKIGNNVRVHSNCFICEHSILEDDCWIGPGVLFTNALHPKCPKVKKCLKGPIIEKGAKIGAGAILMPGVTIGENALVGSGSVVTRDVTESVVVIGNPAKEVKKIKDIKCPFGYIKRPY